MTKCYICERVVDSEADWEVCPDCEEAYPYTSEAILAGELVCIRYPSGITLSGANLVFKLVKKK